MPSPSGSEVVDPAPAHAPETAEPPLLTVLAGCRTAAASCAGEPPSSAARWTPIGSSSTRKSPAATAASTGTRTGLCTLEDLGSRWGTKINGAALSPDVRAPLQPGDRLHIGPVQVYFGYGPPPAALAVAEREAGSDADGAPPIRGPQVLMGSREVRIVPLDRPRVRFGRLGEVDVILADPGISRQHAVVEKTATGFQVTDLRSRAGSLVNGRRFETHPLVIGDLLQMGPYFFRFDGRALERTTGLAGVEIDARSIRKVYGAHRVLDDVTLRVDRGTFVGILGPSGAGKSSLLNALTGLRPADAGAIRFDGADLYQEYDRLRSLIGYVPQDDIVHRELTVSEALFFSARLRLPAGTPEVELRKLVAQTVERLGLAGQARARVQTLSGGQRKRVSVGVELLGRPAVLFLDEPTSGLDPAAEGKMMALLRGLADSGCTVVCTTHVMENVYLTDRLLILMGGRLVFAGEFGRGPGIFRRAQTNGSLRPARRNAPRRPGTRTSASARAAICHPRRRTLPSPPRARRCVPSSANPLSATLPVLLRRQWAILRADPRNFLILFGQPLLIALLVVWVTDDTSLTLFFAYLATLWFGCSNAAQEIVRELPIYRRERTVGLGRHAYLLSKFSLLGKPDGVGRACSYTPACGRCAGGRNPDALAGRGLGRFGVVAGRQRGRCGVRGGRHRAGGVGAGARRHAGDDDRAARVDPADPVFGPRGGSRPRWDARRFSSRT